MDTRRGDERIHERNNDRFVKTCDDRAAFGRGDHLDVPSIEPVAALHERIILPRLLEDRLTRDVERVLDLPAVNRQAQRRSGAHRGIGMIERKDDIDARVTRILRG